MREILPEGVIIHACSRTTSTGFGKRDFECVAFCRSSMKFGLPIKLLGDTLVMSSPFAGLGIHASHSSWCRLPEFSFLACWKTRASSFHERVLARLEMHEGYIAAAYQRKACDTSASTRVKNHKETERARHALQNRRSLTC